MGLKINIIICAMLGLNPTAYVYANNVLFEPSNCNYGIELGGFIMWRCIPQEEWKEQCLNTFVALMDPSVCDENPEIQPPSELTKKLLKFTGNRNI